MLSFLFFGHTLRMYNQHHGDWPRVPSLGRVSEVCPCTRGAGTCIYKGSGGGLGVESRDCE